MKKMNCFVFTVFLLTVFLSIESFAQDKCAKYYGKGYCTDYIKARLDTKQSGNAGTWSSNINIKDVRQGDVAIFSSPSPFGHVAVVERVIYERNTDKPYQVEISEWNWGTASANADEKACAVTTMFAKSSRRTVRVTAVKGFWRP